MFHSTKMSFLGLCLVVLFASSAHAETVLVNPGTVDGNAQDFQFYTSDTDVITILWSDNKTLEYTSGIHLFLLFGQPCVSYAGVLLDAAGDAIPGSELAGRTQCTAGSDLSAGVIDLPEATVFSGIRLISGAFNAESGWQWTWEEDEKPVVGQAEVSGNQPPVADAGGPYEGTVRAPVTFDASDSIDPDGTIDSHCWDFGDDVNFCGEVIDHTYESGGVYNVILTVTDEEGAPNSTTTIANIGTNSLRPRADAGGPYSAETSEDVTFDGTGSSDQDGYITLYTWDYGDGSPPISGLAQPSHRYGTAGTYYVTLTVTDDTGETDDSVRTATITNGAQAPVADAGPPVQGTVGSVVTFDGSNSSDPDGPIAQYDWDYGDTNTDIDAGPKPSHTYTAPGDYTVLLTVTDGDGVKDTATTAASIDANPLPPQADANGPYAGLVGEAISFDASASTDADGDIVQYDWDFGDGNTAPDGGPTPSNTYSAAGRYDVTLTITDDDNLTDTVPTTALVATGNLPPEADAGGPYTGVAGVAVSFDGRGSGDVDGSIAQYDWDFGDGNTAIDGGPTPGNTYAAAGTYDVTLTVTDNDGDADTEVTAAVIDAANQPPTADPNGPYTGTVGVAVAFDGSASSDPNGTITQYDWDFGDGNTAIDGGPTPGNIYAAAGTYDVTLTVTDNDGTTSSESFTTAAIDSANVPPVADADGPYVSGPGSAVEFDGSGSTDADGDIAQYDWDFGDGQTANNGGATPSYVYAAAGVYDVVLTVTDDNGDTANSGTQAIISDGINLPPTADASGPYTGRAGIVVTFDGTASADRDGGVVDYAWDFGDGNNGTGATPSHSYAAAGNYRVSLTVTDDGDLADTQTTVAAIGAANQPPTSDAGGPYVGAVGAIATILVFDGSASSDPDGEIVQYDWDFGDGNGGSGLYSTHSYSAPGSYTATLTVTDNDDTTDQSTATVIIGDGAKLVPRADANGPYNGVVGVPLTVDGSNSSDPDGTIDVYSWAFGDGNSFTGPTPANNFASGALYSVILQVTDDDGITASDSTIARVGDLSLAPSAVANPGNESYKGRVGVPVTFNGGASSDPDGTVNRYDWAFGDGNVANDAGPVTSNTYATDGTYFVRLTVTDDSGETDTTVTAVTIGIGNVPPVADAGPVVTGTAGGAITFNGTASDDPDGFPVASYAWNFGDGNTGTGPNPAHTYAVAGMYFVTLTVTDEDGAVSSDVTLVDVGAASVSVDTKTEGGGAFGVFEMLLLAFAAGLRAAVRAWRAGSRQGVAAMIALTGILLIAPLQGGAADLGWYGALGVGSSDADFSSGDFESGMAAGGHTVTSISSDDSDTGYKVYGGVTWGDYFAGELGYVDLGEATVNFDATTTAPDQLLNDASNLLPVLGDGIALAAIGRYPFGDRFSVFGKVGAYFWEADADLNVSGDVTGSGSPDDDGTDLLYGIGGELYFPDVLDGLLGVRLEWERFELGDDDVDLVSASVLFRFGSM